MLRTNKLFPRLWGFASILVLLSLVFCLTNPTSFSFLSVTNKAKIDLTIEPDHLDEIEIDVILLILFVALLHVIIKNHIFAFHGSVYSVFSALQLPPPKMK
jgi:hypothetical protein